MDTVIAIIDRSSIAETGNCYKLARITRESHSTSWFVDLIQGWVQLPISFSVI